MPKNNFLKKNNPILDYGSLLIRESISSITTKPGVYFMKNKNGNFLYIGKAKNLRKRISSYSNLNKLNPRIKKIVNIKIKFLYFKINIILSNIESIGIFYAYHF